LAGKEKNATFEELLRRRLHDGHDTGATQCPDTAILAAYYERTLPRTERPGWEAHFAACSRCRASLAAIDRADAADRLPARINASTGWRMRIPARIGAAALAAVAVGVIVIVRAMSPRPVAVTELASSTYSRAETRDQAGSPNRLTREKPTVAEKAPARNQPFNDREALQAASPPVSTSKSRRTGASSGRPAPPAEPPMAASQRADMPQHPAGDAAMTGGAPSSPSNAIESKSLTAPSAASGAAGAVGGSLTGARDAILAKSQAAKTGPAKESALLDAGTIAVASPDSSVVWTVGAHGTISRLVKGEGFATQQRSGVDADLTAGSAPSSSVCWVVGRAGVITRTVDGEHWARVSSPTSADLTGVSAQSGSDAIIIAARGQRFATTDGGATWRPL
jgi:hypothetical protein